jgi:chromosome segregation ATPase
MLQIQELNLTLQEHFEKHQHLEDKVAADKEKYCALEENYQKLEQLLVASESSRNEESQSKADLLEETEQLKEMLQVVRQNCKDLEAQILESKAMMREETNAKMTLLEDKQDLAKTIECHEERCKMLEEQIFNAESIINDERESKLKLAEEVHQLKESLQQSMTDFSQVQDRVICRVAYESTTLLAFLSLTYWNWFDVMYFSLAT